jgi:hypothetical protein
MKLAFAAPSSGLPSEPTAFGAQASRLHFVKKLFFAAPASGLPSFPTALLSHDPGAAGGACATAEPTANAVTNIANITRFMSSSFEPELPAHRTNFRSHLRGAASELAR